VTWSSSKIASFLLWSRRVYPAVRRKYFISAVRSLFLSHCLIVCICIFVNRHGPFLVICKTFTISSYHHYHVLYRICFVGTYRCCAVCIFPAYRLLNFLAVCQKPNSIKTSLFEIINTIKINLYLLFLVLIYSFSYSVFHRLFLSLCFYKYLLGLEFTNQECKCYT
jgi:hypothetical protein